jgi:hypothetical protein
MPRKRTWTIVAPSEIGHQGRIAVFSPMLSLGCPMLAAVGRTRGCDWLAGLSRARGIHRCVRWRTNTMPMLRGPKRLAMVDRTAWEWPGRRDDRRRPTLGRRRTASTRG